MMKLFIVADYNDADYSKDLIEISEEEFNKFKPLIDAINNFEPYVCRHKYGDVAYHNWESPREDLGELSLYDTYPQFSHELIDEFNEKFLGGLNNPESDYGGGFHTIVSLRNVLTNEVYINGDYLVIRSRIPEKVKAYQKEQRQICSYCRKSDGKSLGSIPFSEMTEEEKELIDRSNNLWKKYI